MDPTEFDVLPATLGAGTCRVFARRNMLKFRHPAVPELADFLVSLGRAFGPPSPADPDGYVLWHRPSGTHLTVYVNVCAAYGGGLRFATRPDQETIANAYAAELRRRSALPEAPDPLVFDLLGHAPSFPEHVREVERAKRAAPAGFFDFVAELEVMLEGFPPPDRSEVVVHGLEGPGPVTVKVRGVWDGRHGEKQPTFAEAHQAFADKLDGRAERLGEVLFDWWAQRERALKPTEAALPLLLPAWRARFAAAMAEVQPAADESYNADARARHEDHEQAQRWMRFARLGLLLPLAAADANRLAACARGLATQSAEYKKLAKLQRVGPKPA